MLLLYFRRKWSFEIIPFTHFTLIYQEYSTTHYKKLIKLTCYFFVSLYKLSCFFRDILIIKSKFQLFNSTVNKWTHFKSDFTNCINFRPCVSFLWFPLLILEKENGIWLEWKCILWPILIFHLQVTSCNVLLLWSNNENVSVYSHYSSKVKQPKPPGAKRTTLCEFNGKVILSVLGKECAGRPIFSLQQLNQWRIFKKLPYMCSNTEGRGKNENTRTY